MAHIRRRVRQATGCLGIHPLLHRWRGPRGQLGGRDQQLQQRPMLRAVDDPEPHRRLQPHPHQRPAPGQGDHVGFYYRGVFLMALTSVPNRRKIHPISKSQGNTFPGRLCNVSQINKFSQARQGKPNCDRKNATTFTNVHSRKTILK